MVTAIVLIKARIDDIPSVANQLAGLDHVAEVYSTAGRYDLVALVRVGSPDELETVIPGALDKVPGITDSETLVAFRKYDESTLEAGFNLGLD